MARLKDEYTSRMVAELEQKLGTTNKMLVPRLQKIVINMGFGIVSKDEQKQLADDLMAITGQKPQLCRAKKSISNFKLREGMIIGAKVTLRGERMWEFADRLISVALPVFATSAAFPIVASTAAATIRSVSRSTRSSPKSSRKVQLTPVWTSRS